MGPTLTVVKYNSIIKIVERKINHRDKIMMLRLSLANLICNIYMKYTINELKMLNLIGGALNWEYS